MQVESRKRTEGSGTKALARQVKALRSNPLVRVLLDAANANTVILNEERRILFASRSFLHLAGVSDDEALIGLRLGDAWHCVHAPEGADGCGSSESCRHCAVFGMVRRAMDRGIPVEGEAAILQLNGGEERTLNLLEHAVPAEIFGETLYVITMIDISDTLHRRWMEKLFFHDMLNKLGALSNYIQLLRAEAPAPLTEELVFVEDSFRSVLEDVKSHKQLTEAENDELQPEWMTLSPTDIVEQAARLFGRSDLAHGMKLRTIVPERPFTMRSDYLLLRRIVENMVKNALEAENPGAEIEIGCERLGETVRIWVSNPTRLPDDVRSHVFERSFSTKGAGRGLGTYSMKVLGEKVLGGLVGFVCGSVSGTEFFILLPIAC